MARNIASDVVTTTLSRSYNNNGQNGNRLMVMSRGSFKPPVARIHRGSGCVKKAKHTSKKHTLTTLPCETCKENRPCQKTPEYYFLNHVSIPQHVGGMY